MRDDPLAAARGIFNALLLSIAFWLLLTVAAGAIRCARARRITDNAWSTSKGLVR